VVRLISDVIGAGEATTESVPAAIAIADHVRGDPQRAIEIAGNGDLYFDPAFKNASHAAVVFLQDLVTTLDADEDADKRAIFAAFSKPTIERVAREAGHSVVEQFSVHLHSPARQQAAG